MLRQWNMQMLMALIILLPMSQALHFYLKPGQVKCFYENLSVGNLMIGDIDGYVQKEGKFMEDPQLRVTVSVAELFNSNHKVMNQNNPHVGDFAFTALEDGEHRICIMPTYPRKEARLGIFLELEITNIQVLDTRGTDDQEMLRQRVLQMIQRLEGILLQQRFIRENEVLFKNQSDSAYSKILWWSCVQVLGLAVMSIFQLRYLKNCFVKQKLI